MKIQSTTVSLLASIVAAAVAVILATGTNVSAQNYVTGIAKSRRYYT